MKQIEIFLLSFIFFFFFSCSKTKKEYYHNNKLKSEIEFSDGVPHGEYKYYYETGELKEKGNHQFGLKIDSVFCYYKTGVLSELKIFKNNFFYIYNYNEKGLLIEKGSVKNKDTLGWWFTYDDNDKMKSKKSYYLSKGNMILNQEIYYNSDGNIDQTRSKYYVISKDKNYVEYKSQYDYKKFRQDRFLLLMLFDTIGQTVIEKKIQDTLYTMELNSNKFDISNYRFVKGFFEEIVFIDTIVKDEKMTNIKTINTFFINDHEFNLSE